MKSPDSFGFNLTSQPGDPERNLAEQLKVNGSVLTILHFASNENVALSINPVVKPTEKPPRADANEDARYLGEAVQIEDAQAYLAEYLENYREAAFLPLQEGIPKALDQSRVNYMNVSDADVNTDGGDLTDALRAYSMRGLGYSSPNDVVLIPEELVPFAKGHVERLAEHYPNYFVLPENIVGFTREGDGHIDLSEEAIKRINSLERPVVFCPFLFKDSLHIDVLAEHTQLNKRITLNARTKAHAEKLAKLREAEQNLSPEERTNLKTTYEQNLAKLKAAEEGKSPEEIAKLREEFTRQEQDRLEEKLGHPLDTKGLNPSETSESIYKARRTVENKVFTLEVAPSYGINVPNGKTVKNERDLAVDEIIEAYNELFKRKDGTVDPEREFALKEPHSASGQGIYKFKNLAEFQAVIQSDDPKHKGVKNMLRGNEEIRVEAWEAAETIVAMPGIIGSIFPGENGEPVFTFLGCSGQSMDGHEYAGSFGNSSFLTKDLLEQAKRVAFLAFEHGYTGPFSVDMLVLLIDGELVIKVNEINARQTGQFTIASLALNHGTLENKIISDEDALEHAKEIISMKEHKKYLEKAHELIEQSSRTERQSHAKQINRLSRQNLDGQKISKREAKEIVYLMKLDLDKDTAKEVIRSKRRDFTPQSLHNKQWIVENMYAPQGLIDWTRSRALSVLDQVEEDKSQDGNNAEEIAEGINNRVGAILDSSNVAPGTEANILATEVLLDICLEITQEVKERIAKQLDLDIADKRVEDSFVLLPINAIPHIGQAENGNKELEPYKYQMHASLREGDALYQAGWSLPQVTAEFKKRVAKKAEELGRKVA